MSIQWTLVLFSLIAGAGGAALAFAGLGEFLKMSAKDRLTLVIIGIILLFIGGICSVFHLKSPGNFMAAITHLTSFSGISIELLLIGAVGLGGVIYLICLMRKAAGAAKVFGVICLVLGIALTYGVGSSYQIVARAGWNTVLVPLCYATSSIAAGGLICMAVNKEDKSGQRTFGLITAISAALAAILAIAYGAVAGEQAGSTGIAFYVVSALGSVVAAICAFLAGSKDKAALIWVGLLGAIVGGLFIRMFMWAAGSNMFDAFTLAINARALFLP